MGSQRLIIDFIRPGRGQGVLELRGEGLPVHARDLLRRMNRCRESERLAGLARQPIDPLVSQQLALILRTQSVRGGRIVFEKLGRVGVGQIKSGLCVKKSLHRRRRQLLREERRGKCRFDLRDNPLHIVRDFLIRGRAWRVRRNADAGCLDHGLPLILGNPDQVGGLRDPGQRFHGLD